MKPIHIHTCPFALLFHWQVAIVQLVLIDVIASQVLDFRKIKQKVNHLTLPHGLCAVTTFFVSCVMMSRMMVMPYDMPCWIARLS